MRRLATDDGMTLVEVVIASAILFIILTGVLGLIGETLAMSAQAKQINATNNAVNSYVEWVRSLKWDEVNMSTEPTGSIEATSVVASAYTISIEPSVGPVYNGTEVNENLKRLYLRVVTTRADGEVNRYETSVLIRNRDQYMVEGRRDPGTDPNLEFNDSTTPPEGEVVRGTGVPVGINAYASTGRMLETGSMWVDNVRKLRSLVSPFIAEWEINDEMWNPLTFYWDTTAENAGVPQVPDGLRTVVVYVRDSESIEVYTSRQFIVDNFAPAAPTNVTHNGAGSMGGKASWAVSYDGTTPSRGYEVEARVQGTNIATTSPFDTGGWSVVYVPGQESIYAGGATSQLIYAGSVASCQVPADINNDGTRDPFNRYVVRVRAVSAHPTDPLRSGNTLVDKPFVTRPLLTGSVAINGKRAKPNLAVTAPQFPLKVGAPITYEWHRVTYMGTAIASDNIEGTTTTPLWAPTTQATISTLPTALGYYCKVTFTPAGYLGGTAQSVTSNIAVTYTPSQSSPLVEGLW